MVGLSTERIRKRRRLNLARRDPSRTMHATHDLGVEEATVDTSAVFPASVRGGPITFTTRIRLLGTGVPSGVVFEFGDSTTGIKLALGLVIASRTIQAIAGDGVDPDGSAGIISVPAVLTSTDVVDVRTVLSVHPGAGRMKLWFGSDVAQGQSGNVPLTGGLWSSDADGSVGTAHNGTSINGVAGDINGAPEHFSIVEPVRAFAGSLPRSFWGTS